MTIGNSPRVVSNDWDGDVQWKRIVGADPRDQWWLALPSKLLPKQVEQIKRASLGGDLWQQWQLEALMADSWPMYRKCAHEIRQSIANCRYVVRAHIAEEGREPSCKAQQKAETVRRALQGWKPDSATDEGGTNELVYHLTDAVVNGVSCCELQWQRGQETLPRAATWVHPRHYTFTTQGRLVVYGSADYGANLDFNRSRTANQGFGLGAEELARKFVWAKFLSKSGSALGAGLMRPLATWWSYWVYGREWVSIFAQKYGSPFIWATYKPNLAAPNERAAIEQRLREAGPSNYALVPEGTVLNVHPPQSLGANNPIEYLMRQADEACQYLLLGQTATTSGTPGMLGGETVRGEVKRENIEFAAGWIARTLTQQLARQVVLANYGDDEELPTIEPDFTEVVSPEEQARRWSILTGMNMPPTLAEEFYRDAGLQQPKPGDQVIKGGQVVIAEEPMTADEKFEKDLSRQAKQAEVSMALQAEAQGGQPQEQVQGRDATREAIRAATDRELDELEQRLAVAEAGNDGEDLRACWASVKARAEERKDFELCQRG